MATGEPAAVGNTDGAADRRSADPLPRPADSRAERTSTGRPRIAALDVVRGFALCGVVLANVAPIAADGGVVVRDPAGGLADPATWTALFVPQRFFPVFSLLFGVGFSLLLASAAERSPRPRAVLVRRLLALLAVGLVHRFLLWSGDILTVYAVVGLAVLLPSTWLPRWAVAGSAAVLVPVSLLFGGGPSLTAGLFLAGSALTRYGLTYRIEDSTRVPLLVGAGFAAAAAPALWWQLATGSGRDDASFAVAMPVAGLLVAGVYVCVLLVLLRTPLRGMLQAVFAPLGRLALTNYLSATVLVLACAHVLALPVTRPGTAAATAAAVLAVEWLFSTLWSRRYGHGPVERLWRWATWGRHMPFRRS